MKLKKVSSRRSQKVTNVKWSTEKRPSQHWRSILRDPDWHPGNCFSTLLWNHIIFCLHHKGNISVLQWFKAFIDLFMSLLIRKLKKVREGQTLIAGSNIDKTFLLSSIDYDVKLWDFAGMDASLKSFRSLRPCESHVIR